MNVVKVISEPNARRLSAWLLAFMLCCSLTHASAAAVASQDATPTPAAAQPTPERAGRARKTAGRAKPDAKKPDATAGAEDEVTLKAELDAVVQLPAGERVERLRAFVAAHPQSVSTPRARELLVSAQAALGDERLGAGDGGAGIQFFNDAVAEFAPEMADRLFDTVVAQLPANLFLRNHREAAFELAGRIEEKVKDNPRRLLVLVSFYMGVEQGETAARVAGEAVRLAPDHAVARQALGAALRLSLRLDESAAEYARAYELDPRSIPARRGLADMRRATGKPEEAAALYRELVAADAKDAGARAGLVLSLFEGGRREEAERELQSALAAQPENLPLLVGASYWFSSRGEGKRALELAERAIKLEPRYRWVWARVALARALLVERRPLEAEGVLRLARTLGRFPTLDYDLASALAAAGLYDEAAEELAQTFTLKDGRIETRLAGRIPARADNFIELLAPERRASTFLYAPADTPENARQLKALLALHLATSAKGPGEALSEGEESASVAAVTEFGAGEDEMRAFRRVYAAGRLLRHGSALRSVVETTDAAMLGVEAALEAPASSIALLADEMRELRARARAAGAVGISSPEVSRDMRSKILRGRIENLAGWALYNQGNAAEAVVRLRRAVSVLPENSPWWRAAQWHLGAALDANGKGAEALATYVKTYRLGPEPTRRVVIEVLYKKINGTTEGLDRLLSAPPERASAPRPPAADSAAKNTRPAGPTPEELAAVAAPRAAPAPTPAAESPTRTPEATPSPTPTPETAPSPRPSAEEKAITTAEQPVNTPEEVRPEPSPSPAPAQKSETPESAQTTSEPPATRSARGRQRVGSGCTLTLSESAVTVNASGGSARIAASLEGGGDLSSVRATTPNWADIVILVEPRTAADENAQRYTISSVSGKPGVYTVTFASACGKQLLTVTVQ